MTNTVKEDNKKKIMTGINNNFSDISDWIWLANLIPKLNLLTPNVNYSGRTAPLTSKVAFYIFIQQI